MPRLWYVLVELCRELTTWQELTFFFAHSFNFMGTNLNVHNVLQLIRDLVLKVVPVTYPVDPHACCHIQSMMECYYVSGGPGDDDEL